MLGQQLDTIVYHVRPGDNLTKIISRYYGTVTPQKRQAIIQQIQNDNPKVKNPNHIVPNQLLFIDIPPQYCAAPTEETSTPILNITKHQLKPLQQQWNAASPKERDMLSSLAPIMLATGSAGLTSIKTSFQSNASMLQELVELYDEYKANKITKGQYDYRRRKLIQKFESKLGPFRKILSRKKTQRQILRISRKRGRKPTANITRQINKMGKLAKYAKGGGAILTVAGLGVACYEIGKTDDKHEKNEILVESLGSVAGSSIFGIAVGIIFIGTPIGWLAGLAIGVGTVLAGMAGGQGAKQIYNLSGSQIDLVKQTGVTKFCS